MNPNKITLSPALMLTASLLLSACAQQATRPATEAAASDAVPAAAGKDVAPTVAKLEIDKLSAEDRIGLTVHFARVGDLDGMKRLLDAGVDVNGRDSLDQTPLIAAVSQNLLPGVQALLKRGAKVDVVDKAGWTPLHFATFFSTDTAVMKTLLDAGASINAQNDRGITALYFAAATGHEQQVKLLLDRGADQSIASKSGWTPLRITKVKGIEPVLKLLDPDGKGELAPVKAADASAPAKGSGGS